jgi:hypothetical protein
MEMKNVKVFCDASEVKKCFEKYKTEREKHCSKEIKDFEKKCQEYSKKMREKKEEESCTDCKSLILDDE